MQEFTPPNGVVESKLYQEILSLMRRKSIQLSFLKKEDQTEFALTRFKSKKEIQIIFKSSEIRYESIYYHELLHVKLNLLGFPQIRRFNKVTLPTWLENSLTSLENTVEHTYIFKEMEKMKVNQDLLNEAFMEDVLLTAENEDVPYLCHAVNFLELELRDEISFGKVEGKLLIKQKEGYELFKEMKGHIKDVSTPEKMRKAYANLFKLIDRSLYDHYGEEYNLNLINAVHPGYPNDYLKLNSLELLYLKEEVSLGSHIFVLDKIHHQNCLHLSDNEGNSVSQEIVHEFLRERTLAQVVEYFDN
ncbi:hypothetical protein [Paenibacillus sp. QZ-Y1]|uniref:hypothetical protein n=1 Tax=Paenibacillus sp. QZ-Y1 TaxID=3414511 RepID=UPI003F7938FA